MITDNVKHIDAYLGISENLNAAIDFIKNTDLTNLPLGKTDIRKDVWVVRVSLETKKREDDVFEAHRNYIDIHLPIIGRERIDTANTSSLEGYKEYRVEDDCEFLRGAPNGSLILEEEDLQQAFRNAAKAAQIGAESTKNMKPVHGRSAYYKNKDTSYLDGGAVAASIIFSALAF